MDQLLSTSVKEKFSRINVEEELKLILQKKFGQRYLNYRKKYSDYLNKKKTEKTLDYPISAILELVNRCNLECKMCYQGFRNDMEKYTLKEVDLQNLFREFKKNKLDALLLSTSEPLLYKKFPWIIKLAEEAEIMDIFLFTNGILLNEKNSEIILNSNLTRLFISIDALTEKTYDKVRIPTNKKILNTNRLNKLEQNVKNFIKKRNQLNRILPIVRVSFIMLEDNKHEVDGFVRKWEKIVDSVEIQKENSMNFYEDINHIENNNFKLDTYNCNEPWGQVTIHADGTVGPCCNTVGRNTPIGNIRETSLKKIWNGEKMKKIREGFLNNKPNKICQLCLENVTNR